MESESRLPVAVQMHPEMQILFAFGNTGDAQARYGAIGGDTSFIVKPYSSKDLAGKIRELLG